MRGDEIDEALPQDATWLREEPYVMIDERLKAWEQPAELQLSAEIASPLGEEA